MKQRTKRRITALVMALLLVVTTVLVDVPFLSNAAGTVQVNDVEVLINGSKPTDGTTIKDGDSVTINFKWALDNADNINDQFEVNISPLVNIALIDLAETSLFSGTTYVGTVKLEEEKLYINITNKDFLDEYERTGGGTITGEVDVANIPDNGESCTIQIGDYTKTFEYYDPANVPSTMSVNKWKSGEVKYEGGRWVQSFRVELYANGDVSNIKVIDTLGAKLSNMSELKVVESNVSGIDKDATFVDFDALTTGLGMVKNGKIVVEYSVEVNEDIFDNNTVSEDYGNKVKATYNDNKNNSQTTTEKSVSASVNKPSASKTGEVGNDGKVTWTLTIDLKDYAKSGKTFKEMVTSIIDTPGVGFENAGDSVDLLNAAWTKAGESKYTCTYETTLTSEYASSATSVNVKNKVEFTTDAGEIYTGEGSVATNPEPWDFGKTFGTYDAATETLSWTIEVDVLPSMKGIKISDDTNNYYTGNAFGSGNHEFTGNISINDVPVVANGKNVRTDLIKSDSSFYVSNKQWSFTLVDDALSTELLTSPLKITYTTKVTDADMQQKEYKNTAKIEYTSNGLKGSKDAVAVYQVEKNRISEALKKTGKVKTAGKSIEYTLRVNLNHLGLTDDSLDETITLIDTLPDNMVFTDTTDTKFYMTNMWGNEWKADSELGALGISHPAPITPTVSGGVATFDIPVTQDMIDFAKYAKEQTNGDPDAWIYITYETSVDDIKKFTEAGTTNFTNSATGTYMGEDMDPVSVVTQLTPSSVVTKDGTYPVEVTRDDGQGHTYKDYVAKYSIVVNPNGMDLSTGKLIATDTLGSALAYDLDTIKVYDTSTNTLLTTGTGENNYSFAYNYGANSLTFTLPDGTPLRIEYQCTISIYPKGGKLTPDNATNNFSLNGFSSDVMKSEVSFNKEVTEAAFWASSTVGSITLKKFWTNNGTMKATKGCTFNLYEATYDAATDTMVLSDTPVNDTAIEITEDSGEFVISNLEPDKIYCLKEISSGSSQFLTNKEPYYFVIPGATGVTLPDGYEITNFQFGQTMHYENFEAGKLVITKTITGEVTKEEAEGLLQFKVTNKDTGEVIGTYTLKNDFTYDEGTNTWTKTITDIKVGNYEVEETVYDIVGHVCESVKYTVDGGAEQTGTKADVDVKKASEGGSTVAFADDYSDLEAPVTLQLYVNKVNEDNTVIPGVEFKLSKAGTELETFTTVAGAPVKPTYTAWEKDVEYTITEVSAPNQYKVLSAPITFKFADNGTVVLVNAPTGVSVEAHGTEILETQIKIVNEYELITVSGYKIWEDNNDQDGKRPAEITVKLQYFNTVTAMWADVVPAMTATVKKDDVPAWAYTFEDLRKCDDNGNEIKYRVAEVNVPDGYTVTGGEVAQNYNLTNTHTTELTSVKIKKVWDDANNQDGKRPSSIKVQLFADGVQIGERTITASSNWSLEIADLPKYKNGNLIVYTLTETPIAYYTTEINSEVEATGTAITITNSHVAETRSIEATKAWVHGSNPDPAAAATFTLYADGTAVAGSTKTVTNAENWKATWTDLPKYKNGGQEIVYTVIEKIIPNYTTEYGTMSSDGKVTITNTYAPKLISVTATKVWDDANNQDSKRPTSVTVQLYKNDVAESPTVELNAANNWSHTWVNLNDAYTYKVKEVSVPAGYTVAYATTGNTTIITNSYTPEVTRVNVKKNWVNDGRTDAQRPNVTIELLADGVPTGKTITLTPDNGWSGRFDNLPKYKVGDATGIVYTVVEVNPPFGYTVTYSNMTADNWITVTNTFPATARTVKKVWDDANNQDGIRPASITVELYAGSDLKDTVVLDALNNWTYRWESLPLYDGASLINWTVKENPVPTDYTAATPTIEVTKYEDSMIKDATFTLKNTHVPEVRTFVVEKLWSDENNIAGKRPASVTVQLYADNVAVSGKSVVLNASNDWKHTFTNLPVKRNGKGIIYTVQERAVDYYTDEYKPDVAGTSITILNSYKKGKTTHTVKKVWDDANDQDKLRPISIKVQLYGDDVAVGSPVTLSASNNWTYQWTDLDEEASPGDKIVYTVKETDTIPYYTMVISNDSGNRLTTITNKHVPKICSMSVVKVWNDDNNSAAKRPESVTVQLYANAVASGVPVVLSAVNDWKYTWNNLPLNNNGVAIAYTVQEVNVPTGYAASQVNSAPAEVTITNTLNTEAPDVPSTESVTTEEVTTTEEETTEEKTTEEKTTEEDSEEETTEEDGDSDMDSDSEDDGDTEGDSDGPDNPNTGDHSKPFAMMVLMFLSVIGMVLLAIFGKKKNI